MSVPSSALLALIAATPAALTLYQAANYQGVADALNAPTSNTMPTQLTVSALFATLSSDAKTKIWNSANGVAIRDDIVKQDREAVGIWTEWAFEVGAIVLAEHDAIMALLATTTTTTSSIALDQFGVAVTLSDVTATVPAPPAAPAPAVATVTVTAPATLTVGDRATATCVVHDAGGNVLTDRVVHWQGDHTDIVAVFDGGEIAALAEGTADVVAVVDAIVGRSSVTVTLRA